MTEKERVMKFFKNEELDRLPTDDGLVIMSSLNSFEERPRYVQSGVDWFGVVWKREESIGAIAPDHTQPPIMEDICDWRDAVKFPDLENYDWSKVEEIDHVSEVDRENKVFEVMFVNGPFERLHMLMGFENALCSLLTDPEEVTAFLDAFMEWKIRLMEKVIELYQPDVLMFHDDWGTQKGLFFSPDLWRELIKPQIKKAVDRCHELGVIFEMHSCGKMDEIVPDFVELGIDTWNGQEINDIVALKKLTGNKLGYHTTPDYQTYQAEDFAGTLTEEDLRKRVREALEANAKGGHYFPRFSPFGGKTRDILIDEINKQAPMVKL